MVIHCSLARFLQGYQSGRFLDLLWRQFSVNIRIFGFLDTFSQFRFSHVCIVILADRSEVALAATEWRLDLGLSSWSVPTPPVAAYPHFAGFTASEDDELEADQG